MTETIQYILGLKTCINGSKNSYSTLRTSLIYLLLYSFATNFGIDHSSLKGILLIWLLVKMLANLVRNINVCRISQGIYVGKKSVDNFCSDGDALIFIDLEGDIQISILYFTSHAD